MDYESLDPCDILFLSDSLKSNSEDFSIKSFKDKELEIIRRCIKKYPDIKFGYSASVKCPDVRESDMTPEDRNLCRVHLFATIEKMKPKLIFACGNLSVVMLIRRSGVHTKRGSYFPVDVNGVEYKVIPLVHPTQVFLEPKHLFLFRMDIDNAINKYIFGNSDLAFDFKICRNKEDLRKFEYLWDTEDSVSCDTETTGLDFKKDKIQSVSFATKKETVVFPMHHKDANLTQEDLDYFRIFIKNVLCNTKNKKVFQNGKFDLKMFYSEISNIKVNNIWDTQVMYHLVDENAPKSLKEITKRFFPENLENL